MITILKKPFDCSFSKNPIDFEVQTNMYYQKKAFTPEFEILFRAVPFDDQYFTFEFINPNDKSVERLHLVATPNPTAFHEIPDTSEFPSMLDPSYMYMALLKEKFQNSNVWNAWFDIEVFSVQEPYVLGTTRGLRLKAKSPLSDLIINFSSNQAYSILEWKAKADLVESQIRNRYRMTATVFFEKEYLSNNFEVISYQEVFLNDQSRGNLDISKLLNDTIESTWETYPLPFLEELFYKAKNLKRFYVEFSESWLGEKGILASNSGVLHVHWGGVSTNDLMMGNALTFDFGSSINFLTWWPSGKMLTKSQNDWLSWMNRLPSGNFYFRLSVQHEGINDVLDSSLQFLSQWETIVLNVGFEALGLDGAFNWNEVEKWSIQILDENNNIVSPVVNFYPDRGCIKKTVLYFNSFGMPETFNTTNWVKTMNVSSTIATRTQSFNASLWMPQSFIFDSKHKNAFKCTTAVLTNEQADRLQPLLNSTISYVEDNNRWVPIVVQNNKGDLGVYNDFQQILDLEIVMANENDRASFYGKQITIELDRNAYDNTFSINLNQVKADAFGDLETYDKDGNLYQTFTYDYGLKKYVHAQYFPFEEGIYHAYALISSVDQTYKVYTKFEIKYPELVLQYFDIGDIYFALALRSDALPNRKFQVDWGDGEKEEILVTRDENFHNLNHTFSYLGRKEIRIKRQTFEDVIGIDKGQGINNFEISLFKNLEVLYYQQAPAARLYLSQLQSLKTINISSPILNAEIGYQPNLENFSISFATSLASSDLDAIIKELWSYRKLYNQIPSIYISTMPYSVSSLIQDIKDGTGDYVGEGLESDYGWTFVII